MAPIQIFNPTQRAAALEIQRPTGATRELICGSQPPQAASFSTRLMSEVRSVFGLRRSLDDTSTAYWGGDP